MANNQNKSSRIGGIDYTDAVIKAVRAGGNPSFANWRNTLIQQGWDADTANSIKYDPVSGRFLSTQKERYMGDMQAPHSGKLTPDETVTAENGANPGRRLDAVGKSEIPNYSSVSAADEGLAAAVSTVKQVKDALGPDALKKFLAALQLLGFGSGAADGHSGWSLAESRIAEPSENPADSVTQEAYDSVMGDRAASHRAGSPARPQLPPRQPAPRPEPAPEPEPAPRPEPGIWDFIGNGNGFLWDSTAPASGYRPEEWGKDRATGGTTQEAYDSMFGNPARRYGR